MIHIGANDFTNCNWGTAVQSAKEAALAAELPGILKRCAPPPLPRWRLKVTAAWRTRVATHPVPILRPRRLPTIPAAASPTASRSIWSSVTLLRMNMPNTEIVILGVLPRGTGTGKGAKNAANNFGWPSHYTKATVALNAALRWALAGRDRGGAVLAAQRIAGLCMWVAQPSSCLSLSRAHLASPA